MKLKGVDEFTSEMEQLTYFAMGVGSLWAIVCIVIGGMLLAGSGGNASKRNMGLTAIFMACVGLYIVYKAYTIAGWSIALG